MAIVLNHKKLLGFRIVGQCASGKAGVKIGGKPGGKPNVNVVTLG